MIPTEMRAVEITQPGGPDVLQVGMFPVPEPEEHEVLIRIYAAGVNRSDVAQRQGIYPPPSRASTLPGLEIAGEVVARGKNASRYPLGAKVMALVPGGGYAEFATADERNVLSVPKNMDYIHAAAIPETFFTVWSNVFQCGQLSKGEILLIHGGSSGVGTTAIQLAKAFGSFVIITAGTTEKCKACLDLGADLAINYRTQDFVKEINEFTHKKGVNVILDMIGGNYTELNYKIASVEGRIVQIAFLNGYKATINLNTLMVKRLIHTGSTLRAQDISFKAEIANTLQKKVWPLLENRTVYPLIDEIMPLDQAAKAHEHMEKSAHIGKIVLKVS
ncbi:MAG: NAD(P)H quinone oxidoreductase [Candidatus Tokpelaia sp. JSC189]|nr:MAG: NAD(P)H quinone oxidoreductase [Candidatus Tokpelaia sp. JSC189]